MAYQPIQGSFNGVNQGIESLTESLRGLAEWKQRRRQHEQAMGLAADERAYQRGRDALGDQRQRTADFQAAYVKAKALADAGDLDGAKALLAPYVTGLQTIDAPGTAPSQQAAPSVAVPKDMNERRAIIARTAGKVIPPMPGQGPAPAPSRTPQMDAYARTVAPEVQGEGGQPSDPLADDAALQFGNEIAGIAAAPPQQPPIMAMQSNNPIIKARQGEIARNQERARKLLQFRDPTGQSLTLDPQAGEMAQREQGERIRTENLRVFDEVVSQLDPETQRYAVSMRPAVGMSKEPLRGGDVLDYISSLRNRDAAVAAAAAAKSGDREFTLHRDQIQNAAAEQRARISASGRQVVSPGTAATNARGDLGALRQDVNDWQKDSGYNEAASAASALQEANALLSSNNALSQTAARFSIGRKISGPGAFTDAEQKNIIGSVSGKYGSFEATVQKFEDGTMGETDRRVFLESVRGQLAYKAQQMKALSDNFRQSFMAPGSGYEAMEANVANQYNRLFGSHGMEPTPVEGRGATLGVGQQKLGEAKNKDAVRARRAKAANAGIDLDRLADEIVGGATKRR